MDIGKIVSVEKYDDVNWKPAPTLVPVNPEEVTEEEREEDLVTVDK